MPKIITKTDSPLTLPAAADAEPTTPEDSTAAERPEPKEVEWEEEEERDTLVSNYLASSEQPPLVIELCVEVPKAEEVADPAERVIEALSESLKALGWRPTVVCARRSDYSENVQGRCR
jgi:hypothetical protein